MAQFASQQDAHGIDNRVFGVFPKPAMIDLSTEDPNNQPNNVYNREQKIVIINSRTGSASPHWNQANRHEEELIERQTQSGSAMAQLEDRERKLAAEIHSFQARPYSPYQAPPKIDLSSEQEAIQAQWLNSNLGSRPTSRASSTRAATIERDLLENEAKLFREIEEMERKPYSPQQLLVDREDLIRSVEGKSPLLGQVTGQRSATSSPSIHTAIIRQPRREVDNKSPLPFSFDNFTTKGVRGNIATVGAVEPDRPQLPIYPIVRRGPGL